MNLATLLTLERTSCHPEVGSKKRALEHLSELFLETYPNMTRDQIFDQIVGRERLGSTGLGRGVAIPHCRLDGITEPALAMVLLKKPIDYDAPDKRPVDLLSALVVPTDCNEEHLQILAKLAEMLGDERLVTRVRTSQNTQMLFDSISSWGASHAS